MPGIKNLRRLQIGKETTDAPGTAVNATAMLWLNGLWLDERTVTFPEEYTGIIGGRDRNHTDAYLGTMTMDGEATFEQLPYILEASIMKATPTTDAGTGSGVLYTYNFPTTAQGEISTYTIEAGDDNDEEEGTYSFVKDFTLSGNFGEPWMISANWEARTVDSSNAFTPTTDLTISEPETMLFGLSRLYIDDTTGTIGTTQVSNTFLNASLAVTSGWMSQQTGDNSLSFAFIKRPSFDAVLDVTFEHNASAVAEKEKWRLGTARLIRVLVEGSTLTSAGTYTKKTMIVDLPGKWESFDVLSDINGNDVVTGKFRVRYNATYAAAGSIKVVNQLTALP